MTRYALRDLIDVLAIPDPTICGIASRLGVHQSVIHRGLTDGLNWVAADEVAIRAGQHPAAIWPTWSEDAPTLVDGRTATPRGDAQAFLYSIPDMVTDECIDWPYGLTQAGYGQVKYEDRNGPAHRAVYHLVHGQWPRRLGHTCNRPCCVNPRHLVERGRGRCPT